MYHYSKYPPSFYQAELPPRGTLISMSSTLASDAGLWNLAWLTYASPFKAYEDDSVPQTHKPLLMPQGPEYIKLLGQTLVHGRRLQSLAATLTAGEVLGEIDHAVTLAASLDATEWKKWLAFARRRARNSHDVKCDASFFQNPEQLSKAAREDIEFQNTLPKPPLPVFTTRTQEGQINFSEWLDGLKRGTVQ
ncbi:MAG: hypothetical protein ING60_11040 [Rhodocyclaceae bacterium]|nr:hypothetical protein [Rhodocyclaceae bacterium]